MPRRAICAVLGLLTFLLVGFDVQAQLPEGTGDSSPTIERPRTDELPGTEGELAVPSATVRFRGLDLFVIRDVLGPKTPEERARAIEVRVDTLAAGSAKAVDTIEVHDRQVTTDVISGEVVLFTITERDAAITGRTRQQLAADYTRILKHRLAEDFQERSLSGVANAAMYSLGVLAVFLVVLLLINTLTRRISSRILSWEGTRIKGWKLQRFEFLPAARVVEVLVGTLRLARAIGLVVLSLLSLNVILSFFPWTRAAAETLFSQIYSAIGWVVGGIIGYLPNIFYIVTIVVATSYGLRFLKLVFRELEKGTITIPGFFGEWATPTYKIVRFLFLAFVAVIIFPYLPGSGSPAFQGVSLFLGLLLSLGSTAAVANVVAGIVLTYMRPFSVGDRVKIADTIGDIVEKTLLVVRIRTVKNVEITIANAMVLNNHIVNYSTCASEQGLVLHTAVTIGYDVPWPQVHRLLKEATEKIDGILPEPAPYVLQTSLDDFYVSYELNAYTNSPQRMSKIYSDLHAAIQDAFNEESVEILSPHYRAARDGNAVALPAKYLADDYAAPAFRVKNVDSDRP